jgi:hypothetical protein
MHIFLILHDGQKKFYNMTQKISKKLRLVPKTKILIIGRDQAEISAYFLRHFVALSGKTKIRNTFAFFPQISNPPNFQKIPSLDRFNPVSSQLR